MQSDISFRFLFGPNTVAATSAIVVTRSHGRAPGNDRTARQAGFKQLTDTLRRHGLDNPRLPPTADRDWAALMGGMIAAIVGACAVDGLEFKGLERNRSFAVVGSDIAVNRLCIDAAIAFHDYWQAGGRIAEADLAHAWRSIRDMIAAAAPERQIREIIRACAALDIPFHRFSPYPSFAQLGEGRHRLLVDLTDTSLLPHFSMRLAADKAATNRIMAANGIPVARQHLLDAGDDAWKIACEIGLPVVVKPRGGNRGRGVTTGVATRAALDQALADARAFEPDVLLESYLPGDDHRIYVSGGEIIGALRNSRAHVTGDGRRSIRALVEDHNRRLGSKADLMAPIELGATAAELLAGAGMDFDSMPAAGQRVELSVKTGNYAGGMPVDVRGALHPDNAAMLVRAVELIGLPIAGIDFRTPDISQSWRDIGGGICEVNSRVGFKVLLLIDPDRAGEAIVSAIAGRSPRRMRHILVIGADADASALDRQAQAVGDQLARLAGWRHGLALHSGLKLGKYQAGSEPMPLFLAYRRIIENPLLDAGIYCCTPDTVRRHGFGLNRADLAIFPADQRSLSQSDRDFLLPFVAACGARTIAEPDMDAALAALCAAGDEANQAPIHDRRGGVAR